MGAIAALLFAPRSGREMRSGLKGGSERLKERAYDVASQIRERSQSAVRRAKGEAEHRIEGMGEGSRSFTETEEPTAPRPFSTT